MLVLAVGRVLSSSPEDSVEAAGGRRPAAGDEAGRGEREGSAGGLRLLVGIGEVQGGSDLFERRQLGETAQTEVVKEFPGRRQQRRSPRRVAMTNDVNPAALLEDPNHLRGDRDAADTVSYTHLDVYKRQPCSMPLKFRRPFRGRRSLTVIIEPAKRSKSASFFKGLSIPGDETSRWS